jgi:hypothetical protein
MKREKQCPKCGVVKPLTRRNFVTTKSRKTGKTYWKHCRTCDSARQKAQRERVKADPELAEHYRQRHTEDQRRRYQADPEKHRAYQRAYRAKLKEQEPERYGELFLIPRRFRRENRPAQFVGHAKFEPYRPPSCVDSVPAEPFRVWLERTFAGWTLEEIARAAGYSLPVRRLYGVLHEQDTVSLDAVDRFCTVGLGRPDVVNVLYPYQEAA